MGAVVKGRVVGRRTVNGLTVVQLAGELDVVAVHLLRRNLRASHFASLPDLAVDLRAVTFIDCATVGVLIATRNRVALAGGLLALCRLGDVLCVHESLEEATAVRCAFHASLPDTGGPPPHHSLRY
jgi:anti-sigma B factor antagonist